MLRYEKPMFDKTEERFPIKSQRTDLNHCGIAPMYSGAAAAVREFCDARVQRGVLGAATYGTIQKDFRRLAARLLRTTAANVSFMKNAAEGLSAIAAGYPFKPGDEVISYIHEYPSNHYPWLLQERRGVKLKLLPNRTLSQTTDDSRPCGWSMDDLETLVTARTRIVAISHVQFTSGFAADLQQLGEFCHTRDIDLVVDAAQSLGCLPVHTEPWHISAVACSGWKWLMGPIGCGLLYTSPALRNKLQIVMAGADIVTQGDDYLDHTWSPYADGRMFEYSTVQIAYEAGLLRCLQELFTTYSPDQIRDEIFRLQDVFCTHLDTSRLKPIIWPERNRSGILPLICDYPEALARKATDNGITVTSRGGYLRVAPHFYNDDDQLARAAQLLSSLA